MDPTFELQDAASNAPMGRRVFLGRGASCAAHLALVAGVVPRAVATAWTLPTRGAVVAAEPFGRLERVADGVWALISTPLGGDRTTLCNGGLIAGRSGVVAVEAFQQASGARWLAERARELTGRLPTHVVLSHFHGDHVTGLDGYPAESPLHVMATASTRDAARAGLAPPSASAQAVDSLSLAERSRRLGDAELLAPDKPAMIDLGDRAVRVVPRSGHTASDLTLEVEGTPVVFCGDLVWNGMFPNYVNASPLVLSATVRALPVRRDTILVPGHGPLAAAPDFARYVAVLDEIERAARAAHARGVPADRAGAEYKLPPSLGEWLLFNPAFFPRAFTAWYADLDRVK